MVRVLPSRDNFSVCVCVCACAHAQFYLAAKRLL